MLAHEIRKSALRRYIVFRIKAIEFLDLSALRTSLLHPSLNSSPIPLPSFPPFREARFVSDSLRTVALSWFSVFIDKSKDGMDVIDLWSTVFPKHASKVQAAWKSMEPSWNILREFRDRAGFHADKPLRFFTARARIAKERKQLEATLNQFEELLKFFLKAEATDLGSELEPALDSLLDELESADRNRKYQRDRFKAYLMIPKTG
jgi:hypothetical protein